MRNTNPTKALTFALGFLALFVLAACSDVALREPGVAIEVQAIADEVDTVTLEVNGQVLSKDATSGSVTFSLKDLPLGQTTFTARGLDGDIVLYKANKTVNLVANQPPVSLTMSRISSSVTVDAKVASGAALSDDEVVVAKVAGGLTQRLVVSGDGKSATGTLAGVPTGINTLTVNVYEDMTLATLTRQGSTEIALSEDDITVPVDLVSLTSSQVAPDEPVITLPTEPVVQGEAFDISVQVNDANGDPLSVKVIWGDGNVSAPKTANDPYSAPLTFTHTYTAPDTEQDITVIVDDGALSAQDTKTVQVTIPADDTTDVDVIIDTEELSTVTLTVTDVPASAKQVQAVITPASDAELTSLDLKDEYVVELVPQGGGTWSATVGLPQNVTYSATTNALDENGAVIASNEVTFTPTEKTTNVSSVLTDGSGGTGDDNADPVANAGADKTVTDSDKSGFESVTLDGSKSADSDGSIVSYTWSANGVSIPAGASTSADFPVGSTTVTLTVKDDDGATDTDKVIITVKAPAVPDNKAPTADAGSDKTVTDSDDNGSESVTLDGSGSSDDDGTISYSWSKNGNEIATGAKPTVTLGVGTHTVTLTVKDDDGATDTDTVTVTVKAAPVSTALAIVPVSTTCSSATKVGDACTISVALKNYDGEFYGFDFGFSFSNDNYSLDLVTKGANLGGSWSVLGFTSVSGASLNPATGDGEIAVFNVTKDKAGSTSFATIIDPDLHLLNPNGNPFSGAPVIRNIEAGTINLP